MTTTAGDRFTIVKDTLSDGSEVYCVRFCCDLEFDNVVKLDCFDFDSAEDLLDTLRKCVSGVEVIATAGVDL